MSKISYFTESNCCDDDIARQQAVNFLPHR